jgi:MFS family permease
MSSRTSPVVRHLAVAQGLSIAGSSVDLTLTGIVGARIAPTPELATLPYSVIFLAAGLTTFAVSRAISRFGHRRVFVAVAVAAAVSGCVSAAAIQLGMFWLFCAGTALIGVYQAGSGYYRYLAADSTPQARPRAVATVLAGGLVAAIVGPFAATALKDATPTPYVASYLLVAALGTTAAVWNSRLRVPTAPGERASAAAAGEPRGFAQLWRQPTLLLGVAAAVLAAGTMLSMMTAGPILGMAVGHTSAEAAFAVQLHMVGMYVPGFFAARMMARAGGRRIALAGAAVIVVAGLAAAVSDALPVYLLSMFVIGVGWNFAYGGGSALIASSYEPAERGRVQPVAEMLIIAAQVAGSLSAAAFTTAMGWRLLGWGCVVLAAAVAAFLALARLRRRPAEALSRQRGRYRMPAPMRHPTMMRTIPPSSSLRWPNRVPIRLPSSRPMRESRTLTVPSTMTSATRDA